MTVDAIDGVLGGGVSFGVLQVKYFEMETRELARVCKNIPRIRDGSLCLVADKRSFSQSIEAQLLNIDTQLQVAVESFRLFNYDVDVRPVPSKVWPTQHSMNLPIHFIDTVLHNKDSRFAIRRSLLAPRKTTTSA